MWTPELVRARFHEAADTERFLPMMKLNNGAGYWPLHLYTQEDRDGWFKEGIEAEEERERWARNRKLTREAIARHDECLVWSMTILLREQYRKVVWAWAFCQAYGRSFSATCKRKGWVRMTAYRRLNASFEMICDKLLGDDVLPRFPDSRFMLQEDGAMIYEAPTIKISAPEPKSQPHPAFISEKSTDLLTSPAALAAFAHHLADVNDGRRKARLRRAKAMRGIPGEQEAA